MFSKAHRPVLVTGGSGAGQRGGGPRAVQNRKEAECDSALASVLQGDVQCHATWGVWRSTAWSEWSAKGQRSLAPSRPQSAAQGRHLTGLRKPGSSASSASGAQSDLCKSLSAQGLSFPTGPKYTRTLAGGSES